MATASDSFTDTNGTELNAHDANWTNLTGTAQIQSNEATGNTNADGARYYYSGTWQDDQYSEAPIDDTEGSGLGGTGGVAVRLQTGADSGYTAEVGGTTATRYMSRYDAGEYTNLGSASVTYDAADILRLEITGSSWEMFLGGVSEDSGTDATYSSGNVGVSFFDDEGGGNLHSWEGGDLGGAAFVPIGHTIDGGMNQIIGGMQQ